MEKDSLAHESLDEKLKKRNLEFCSIDFYKLSKKSENFTIELRKKKREILLASRRNLKSSSNSNEIQSFYTDSLPKLPHRSITHNPNPFSKPSQPQENLNDLSNSKEKLNEIKSKITIKAKDEDLTSALIELFILVRQKAFPITDTSLSDSLLDHFSLENKTISLMILDLFTELCEVSPQNISNLLSKNALETLSHIIFQLHIIPDEFVVGVSNFLVVLTKSPEDLKLSDKEIIIKLCTDLLYLTTHDMSLITAVLAHILFNDNHCIDYFLDLSGYDYLICQYNQKNIKAYEMSQILNSLTTGDKYTISRLIENILDIISGIIFGKHIKGRLNCLSALSNVMMSSKKFGFLIIGHEVFAAVFQFLLDGNEVIRNEASCALKNFSIKSTDDDKIKALALSALCFVVRGLKDYRNTVYVCNLLTVAYHFFLLEEKYHELLEERSELVDSISLHLYGQSPDVSAKSEYLMIRFGF